MKKSLSLLLVLSIVATCFIFVPTVSADEVTKANYDIDVPASWELLAGADFTNEGLTDINGDEVTDILDLQATGITSWAHSGNADATTTSLGTNSLYLGARSDNSNNLNAYLETPIDLTVDGDYYFIFETDFQGGGKQNSVFALRRSDVTYLNTNDNRDELKQDYFHFSANESGSGKHFNVGYQYQAKNPETMGDYAWGGQRKNAQDSTGRMATAGQWVTIVGQMSVRSGKVYQRLKTFPRGEAATYAPEYWDVNVVNTPTWRPGDEAAKELDHINISYSGNSGHITGPSITGFRLYKAPAVNMYTYNEDNQYANRVPVPGATFEILADAALTQSIVWYDVTDAQPVELGTGTKYTIPDSMLGRKIKAVVTTTAGETYEPISGYVHARNEVVRMTATTKGATGFKADDFSTYANATSITFNATIRKPGKSSDKSTYALVTAQYAADGTLKKVMTSQSNVLLNSGFDGTSKATESGKNWAANVFTFDHENVNYAAGDYFKCYIWKSTTQTVGEFAYDSISPMSFNPEMITPVDNTVFTIPAE